MAFYPGGGKTSILSWSQMVREADPNYTRLSLQPWVYEYSNGRLFVDTLPLYGTFDIVRQLLLVGGGVVLLTGDIGAVNLDEQD